MENKREFADLLARRWEKEKSAMPTDPAFDARVLRDASEAYARAENGGRADMRRRRGRAPRRLSLLKWAALPAIIAVLILLLNPFGGVAWGEVAERVDQAPTLILQASWFLRQGADRSQKIPMGGLTGYFSREFGSRMDIKSFGKEAGRLYIGPDEKYAIVVNLIKGTVERVANPEAAEVPGPGILNDPKRGIRELLSQPYRKIGKSRIDGKRVEGIEAVLEKSRPDPAQKKGEILVRRLWVDLKTGLPVREETTNKLDGNMENITVSDYRWNVSLDPSLFQAPPVTKAPEKK